MGEQKRKREIYDYTEKEKTGQQDGESYNKMAESGTPRWSGL